MSTNKRKFSRFEVPVNVKLTCNNGTEMILKSHDISDSGIFLSNENQVDKQLPKVGSQVVVQLATIVAGDQPRELNALVVRHNNDGIGIEFLFDEE